MKITEENQETIKLLARLTDEEIASIAHDAAQAAFETLVKRGVVIGANGDPHALHMRVGSAPQDEFREWGERTLGTGAEFAKNTGIDGKAGTAAEFGMDSFLARQKHGDAVGPEGPRRWRGAKYARTVVDYPDGSVQDLSGSVGSASGAQGPIDEVPSATGAQAVAALRILRKQARALLAEAGIAWGTGN